MELNIVSTDTGDKSSALDVSDAVFASKYNEGLIHQVVTAYMAKGRAGTKANKSRSEVRGGGIKPWRQKGTGRARAGTSRSPVWIGGGVTFAAKPRNYAQKLNKKMYKSAMRSIVSELARSGRMVVVEELSLSVPKTKELAGKLKSMQLSDVLIVTEAMEEKLALASRNLVGVEVSDVSHVDPVSLVAYKNILITKAAVKRVEEMLG